MTVSCPIGEYATALCASGEKRDCGNDSHMVRCCPLVDTKGIIRKESYYKGHCSGYMVGK